jgi:2,4-dienoyl-CoA reductase-like NADH-dependent reductase (Old Yellow Enzyme family)
MSVLFTDAKINGVTVKNRFVRSATYDGSAETTGLISKKQIELFSRLAEGGVGLIITGITWVHASGQASPLMNTVADDQFVPGLSELTRACHAHGAKICLQLFHGGREAWWVKTRNEIPLAPSVIEHQPFFNGSHRAMTEAEIWNVIGAFGEGARRAKQAGFDAVQVHGAHAYLFSQFLSPYTNRRQDQWGGSLENRLRFHTEVYRSIRAAVGSDYPVIIKIGIQDGFEGGLVAAEGLEAARRLGELGFDALEVSSGLRGQPYQGTEYRTGINKIEKEGYFRDWCRTLKRQVNVPIMAVGGYRTFSLMESVVDKGDADFISLSRPLIREPAIINDWRHNQNKKVRCVSCNKCLESLLEAVPLHCIVDDRQNLRKESVAG